MVIMEYDPFEGTHDFSNDSLWQTEALIAKLKEPVPADATPRQKAILGTVAHRFLFEGFCRELESRGFATEPNEDPDQNALNPSKLAVFFREHPELNSIGSLVVYADGLNQPQIEDLELPPIPAE